MSGGCFIFITEKKVMAIPKPYQVQVKVIYSPFKFIENTHKHSSETPIFQKLNRN